MICWFRVLFCLLLRNEIVLGGGRQGQPRRYALFSSGTPASRHHQRSKVALQQEHQQQQHEGRSQSWRSLASTAARSVRATLEDSSSSTTFTPVTDLCLNGTATNTMIKNYLKEQFDAIYSDGGDGDDASFFYLTENGGFNCYCDNSPTTNNQQFTLKCNTMFAFASDDLSLFSPRHVYETMTFAQIYSNDGNSGPLYYYYPTTVQWCEGDYCESFTFASPPTPSSFFETTTESPSPLLLESCSVQDPLCLDEVIECGICSDGQRVFITAASDSCMAFNTTCDTNYTGAFLYDYYNEVETNTPLVELVGSENQCSNEQQQDVALVSDFCSNLTTVENTLTNAFQTLLIDPLEPQYTILRGYDCECSDADLSLSILCQGLLYEDEFGRIFLNNETISFQFEEGHYVVRNLGWCEDQIEDQQSLPLIARYCEDYDMTLGGEDVFECNFGDCSTGFCELCSDGITVADSCRSNNTCAIKLYPGAFGLAYRDLKLAVACTESPTSTPTVQPTSTPMTTSMNTPTTAPTDVSSSMAGRSFNDSVASAVATLLCAVAFLSSL